MTLTEQDLQILLQCLSLTQIQVKDAPRMLEIKQKIEKMIQDTHGKT